MILVDTSAWVEFFRATESSTDRHLTELVESEAPIAVTDPIVMEVLAGARSEVEAQQLRDGMLSFEFLPVGLPDYEAAAGIYRACRRAGETVRSHIDCLIAALAIRIGGSLLHADAHFDVIARHTSLRIAEIP